MHLRPRGERKRHTILRIYRVRVSTHGKELLVPFGAAGGCQFEDYEVAGSELVAVSEV